MIQFSRAELTAQIKSGMSREQLAEHYQVPLNFLRDVLKEAGMSNMKKSKEKPQYTIID